MEAAQATLLSSSILLLRSLVELPWPLAAQQHHQHHRQHHHHHHRHRQEQQQQQSDAPSPYPGGGFFSPGFCAAALLLFAASWVAVHRALQSARRYRGPRTWPLIGCIVEQARNFDTLHDWLLRYAARLPTFSVPMVSINNTFTCDPANVEHILKTNFSNYPKVALPPSFPFLRFPSGSQRIESIGSSC
jgi:hypothetical protein